MRLKTPAYLGMWHHTEIGYPAPGSLYMTIKGWQPLNGDNYEQSGLQYSCDEFPAAKWIEGGDGLNHNGDSAFMRCAPITV
ncbi:hypothetical protein EsH8_III_000005 [Colletotrichum jinshuiense]